MTDIDRRTFVKTFGAATGAIAAGVTPRIALAEEDKKLDWAQRIGPREPTVFENIEVLKNLPPSCLITPESR